MEHFIAAVHGMSEKFIWELNEPYNLFAKKLYQVHVEYAKERRIEIRYIRY